MKRDRIYIEHILQCILRIEEYTRGVKAEDFKDEYLLQDGCIRQLEVIGEATKRLSDTFRDSALHIPWKDMAGMRDILIHDYLNVDVDIVTKTAYESIPALKPQIEALLETFPG